MHHPMQTEPFATKGGAPDGVGNLYECHRALGAAPQFVLGVLPQVQGLDGNASEHWWGQCSALLYSLRFTPSYQVQTTRDFQFIESILAIFARVVPQVGRIQTGLVPTSFNLWLGSSWYGIVPWFDFIPIPHYARYSPWLRPTEWNGGCLYTVDLHRRDMSFGQTHPWSSGCILELWRDGLNLLRLKKLLVKSMSGLFRNIPTRRGASAGKAMLDWSPVSQKLIFQKTHFIKSRW